MKTMMRFMLMAAAATLVPACEVDDDEDPEVELEVVNSGTSTVRVEVEYWDAEDDDWRTAVFDVAAGGRVTLDIYERWAEVVIVRTSDGTKLFDEELDWSDFHDDDATVTVYP